jgi:hypothetical protein
MTRRSYELAAALTAAVGLLAGVFWIARAAPDIDCGGDLTAAQRAAVADFQSGSVPLHVVAGALVLVALLRFSAARRGGGRPGLPTAVAAGAYAALLAAGCADADTLAYAGGVQSFVLFATAPLAALILIAALVVRPARTPLLLTVAWLVLLFLILGDAAAIDFVDEPLCLS